MLPTITIPLGGGLAIEGELRVPSVAAGLVMFADGRSHGPWRIRNRDVAEAVEEDGFATLLLDLLTPEEQAIDRRTAEYRFDIERLSKRMVAAIDWAGGQPALSGLPICCVGTSFCAAAMLVAAAARPQQVHAIISRGGRPDLAGDALASVVGPTLLIVGSLDRTLIDANYEAQRRLRAPTHVAAVPGGTHLLTVPATSEVVCRLARSWCAQYLHQALATS
jgi:putative phosphoribosyl transferase